MSEIRGSVLVEVESAFYSFIIINRHLSRFFGFIRVFSVLMIWFTAMSHGSWQCNRKHYCKWITHSVDKKNQSAKQVGNVQFNLTLKWHVADKQSPIDKKKRYQQCNMLCTMQYAYARIETYNNAIMHRLFFNYSQFAMKRCK